MRPVISAVKAGHYLATALVLTSFVVALWPAMMAPFLSHALQGLLHSYGALRAAGFAKLGAPLTAFAGAVGQWLPFAPPAPWFRTAPLWQDAILLLGLLTSAFLAAYQGARKIRGSIDAWRERRGLAGRHSLVRRLMAWRVLASDAAFFASLLALAIYYIAVYGAGVIGLSLIGSALDHFIA
jgi:hypothetical protein